MTTPWALRLPASQGFSLGALRLAPNVRVLHDEQHEELWLNGDTCDETLAPLLATLPEARQYRVLPDGQLILPGRRVPTGHLPQGDWRILSQWLQPEIPSAALSGERPSRLPLRIVRGGAPTEANVLLTGADDFARYAIAAPQHRLRRLSFAISDTGQAVIRGTPLPPLAGVRFVERQGVAAQAGFRCEPALDADVIANVLELGVSDVALLHGDGRYDRITADQFVQATRSAVRLSVGGGDA